jgi:ribonuclease HI
MALSPEIKKLAQQALKIRNSEVPLHRVIDVLASSDGDVSKAINRYRDIKDAELRRALHFCAELLRAVEQEAGLTAAWEAGLRGETSTPAASPATPSATASANAEAASTSSKKVKFAPSELTPFIDESARGKVRVAKAYVDGASKGNPGDAGIGVAIFSMDGTKIAQESRAIGLATNNIAEYSALIEAMKMAQSLEVKVLNVIGDSELVVKQVSGQYKIKNPEILKKVQEVMALKKGFEKFTISHVAREHNTLADALSTAQLKKKTKSGKAAGSGAAGDEYVDVLGPVDNDADEGATE